MNSWGIPDMWHPLPFANVQLVISFSLCFVTKISYAYLLVCAMHVLPSITTDAVNFTDNAGNIYSDWEVYGKKRSRSATVSNDYCPLFQYLEEGFVCITVQNCHLQDCICKYLVCTKSKIRFNITFPATCWCISFVSILISPMHSTSHLITLIMFGGRMQVMSLIVREFEVSLMPQILSFHSVL